MAGSVNKVLLIGRLGADPEIKQMVNGKNVARLSLATSQTWKDKNTGEKKEKTEWHRIGCRPGTSACLPQRMRRNARDP